MSVLDLTKQAFSFYGEIIWWWDTVLAQWPSCVTFWYLDNTNTYLRCVFYCDLYLTVQCRKKRFCLTSEAFVPNSKCKFWTKNKVTAYYHDIIFDPTLDFQVEGWTAWSKQYFNISMITWNTRNLICERINYLSH